jgi:hypothetical protein
MTTQNHCLNRQKEQNKGKDLFSGKSNISPFKILFEGLQFQSILRIIWDYLLPFYHVRQTLFQCLSFTDNKVEFFIHLNLQHNGIK